MRKLFFSLLLIVPLSFSFAQDNSYCCPFADVFPIVDNTVTYTDVVQEDGMSAQELYKKAKIWMVDAFRSSKDVIQNDDKDNSIIIGKGFLSGYGHNLSIENAKYWFTIKIECRDGRYKYSVSDFIYEGDVIIMGTTTHFKEDFTTWGNVPFDSKYKELLDKKFPPNKQRNDKQQNQYEKYKEELDTELAGKYKDAIERYSLVNNQIKTMINTLKKAMEKADDNW